MSYLHGDFDFNKLFKAMGDDLILKIIKENKESPIEEKVHVCL